MKSSDERWILYSTCDEDSYSELAALELERDDNVVSITGSGCRTLSLLTAHPNRVLSVDYSLGQNALLELKLAAIRKLDYDLLLAFLGVDESADRWKTYRLLEQDLSPKAAAYFRNYRPAIERGVLFSGRHEQFYRRFAVPMLRILFGRTLDRLFSAKTLEEQRSIYRNELDGVKWRFLIKHGFSERAVKWILNNPDYDVTVDVGGVGTYMLERFEHTFLSHLARDNHWLSMMLNGRYISRRSLPHFLLEESCHAIRNAKTDVKIYTGSIVDCLHELPDNSIDKFSLSDVTSCVQRATFNHVLGEVYRIGKEGGIICYRNFLARYEIPSSMNRSFKRDDALCAMLDQDDLAFAYAFEVATILPKMRTLDLQEEKRA